MTLNKRMVAEVVSNIEVVIKYAVYNSKILMFNNDVYFQQADICANLVN